MCVRLRPNLAGWDLAICAEGLDTKSLIRIRAGNPGDGGEGEGALRSFDVHKDKVQAVQWNQAEPTVLLTGSYDRTVRTFDSRAPDAGVGAFLAADVEALRWDPFEPHSFYVSFAACMLLWQH